MTTSLLRGSECFAAITASDVLRRRVTFRRLSAQNEPTGFQPVVLSAFDFAPTAGDQIERPALAD